MPPARISKRDVWNIYLVRYVNESCDLGSLSTAAVSVVGRKVAQMQEAEVARRSLEDCCFY